MKNWFYYSGLATLVAFLVGVAAIFYKVKELNKTWKLY